MNRVGFIVASLAAALLASCTTVQPPVESNLKLIIADAHAGRIDICHDPRWPAWRSAQDGGGKARLEKLRELTAAEEAALDPETAGDPKAWALGRARLGALQSIVRAALADEGEGSWQATLGAQEEWVARWDAKARAIRGETLAAAAARHAIWRRAHAANRWGRFAKEQRSARMAACLFAEGEALATMESAKLVMQALDRTHWPTERTDGPGATKEALSLRAFDLGRNYLKRNRARLDDAAALGRIPMGAWVYMRATGAPEPTPGAHLSNLLAFEKFIASLPPPRNVGEELFRRGRVDQFAIASYIAVINGFKPGPERDPAERGVKAAEDRIMKANAERIKVLLRDRNWFDDERDGEDAETYGWLFVQHADHDPEFQRDVLRRIEPLVAQGRVAPSDYAYLWDRVAEADKRPQRYGTQMRCKDGKHVPDGGVEDPTHLNDRRREMGLGPWEDYAASFGDCPS